MKDIEKIKIVATSTIKEALSVIDYGAVKIALIVDVNKRLLGTLADGDIRRGLLRKKTLNDTIEDIYFKNPITAKKGSSKEDLLHLCSMNKIGQVPLIDDDRRVVDLFIKDDELSKKQYENTVVLMVGGLGKRLRPLTEQTPKSMLCIGEKPILQTIVKSFVKPIFFDLSIIRSIFSFNGS